MRVRIVIPALRKENLTKILVENDKKIEENPCQVGERRKVEKLFENDVFETVKERFLKNLKYDLRLIEKQVRSIKPGRGSHKF